MPNRAKKIIIPLITFICAVGLHLMYFKLVKKTCADIGWFSKYIKDQQYFLGVSYGLSFAFMAFAILKFRENRKAAVGAAVGSGALAGALWVFCFLLGCCSSPMWAVYLNLIGLSALKIPKAFLLAMTIIFIGIGYIWLIKKSSGACCNGKKI